MVISATSADTTLDWMMLKHIYCTSCGYKHEDIEEPFDKHTCRICSSKSLVLIPEYTGKEAYMPRWARLSFGIIVGFALPWAYYRGTDYAILFSIAIIGGVLGSFIIASDWLKDALWKHRV